VNTGDIVLHCTVFSAVLVPVVDFARQSTATCIGIDCGSSQQINVYRYRYRYVCTGSHTKSKSGTVLVLFDCCTVQSR
jgi:hypothetical protein